MITDFTLFNIQIINPFTREIIDQGKMRAREAMQFVKKMDTQGVPTVVQATNEECDACDFMEYMYKNK